VISSEGCYKIPHASRRQSDPNGTYRTRHSVHSRREGDETEIKSGRHLACPTTASAVGKKPLERKLGRLEARPTLVSIGIDCLCMMLLGQESIRDVILFPQLKPK
jgi:tRNA synthetases class II (D, K and N)